MSYERGAICTHRDSNNLSVKSIAIEGFWVDSLDSHGFQFGQVFKYQRELWILKKKSQKKKGYSNKISESQQPKALES